MRSRTRAGAALAAAAALAMCAVSLHTGGASDMLVSGPEAVGLGGFPYEPTAERKGQQTFDGPGSFGSEKVFPARQVFHSYAVFGNNNHFGALSHFREGTHFEEGNTFDEGASFGADTHFGANNHFGTDTTVGQGSTIGAGAVFGEGAVIGKGSVFGPGVSVGAQSYIAGDQVFAGGDHFGAGISFGPNIRFGPNTDFDGDELFAAGSSFGDGTKFDDAGAGKDTFGGGHYFGVSTAWGANEPQISGGGPSRRASADTAGVRHAVVVGLPPGYFPTSIPGVYQYSSEAAPSTADSKVASHDPDPDWAPQVVANGGRTPHEWEMRPLHKTGLAAGEHSDTAVAPTKTLATPAAGATAGATAASAATVQRSATDSAEMIAVKGGRVSASSEEWKFNVHAPAASPRAAAVAAAAAAAGAAAGSAAAKVQLASARALRGRLAERTQTRQRAHFGAGMARWMAAHRSARTGPSSELSAISRHRLYSKASGLGHAAASLSEARTRKPVRAGWGVSRSGGGTNSDKLDEMRDKRVPVARVKESSGIDFFSMFE